MGQVGKNTCSLIAFVALLAAACAAAPALAQGPSFEVASVKRNVSGDPRSGTRTLPGGRIAITNLSLRDIIRRAYGANDIEVVGGPDWIDTDRWDIAATAGSDRVDAPLDQMVRSLLEDRYKLRAHIERRERPVYALVFARSDRRLGPKVHLSACKADDVDCARNSGNTNGIRSGTLTGVGRTMSDIGQTLSRYVERRVLDRTGLDERYDFEVTWSEEVSIFTAIQEQLGLKVDPQRAPVDVVVVDTVQRPIED